MSYLDQIIQNTLDSSARKEQEVAEAAERKKRRLDPTYRSLETGKYRVIDGDTIWDENLQREIRLSGGGGRSPDTFESDTSKYYDRDGNLTDRFYQHKRAYEQMFDKKGGLFRKDVTPEQLADMGRVQGQRLAEELHRMEQAGESLDYRVTGVDDYGRATGTFNSPYFNDLSKREHNANYFSKYNAVQAIDDVVSGEESRDHSTRGKRGLVRASADQAVNFGIGALNMFNDLGQSVNALDTIKNRALGLDKIPGVAAANAGVNSFFSNNKKVFDRWKKYLTSDAQTRSEERAGRESLMNEELYALNVQKYMQQGMGESEAKFNASMAEAGNTIRNLAQSPGRVIDMTFESLPYMMGIAGIGRAALKGAIKSQSQKLAREMLEHGASKEMISQSTSRYLQSEVGQKALQRVSSMTGTTAVGLTEGLSTGAAIYDRIMGMTQEEAMESEKYQALRFDKEMSHEAALAELAEDAFIKTTGWTMLLAGAAGKVSGAGNWEANLLNPLGRARSVVENASKEGVERTLKQRAIAATTETGKYIGRRSVPAAKETLEEGLQSGASQGVTDLALEDEGFGDGIGAGFAEAVVTGAAAGAVSGGGVSTVMSGAKSLGKGIQKLSEINTTGDRLIDRTIKNFKGLGGNTESVVDSTTSNTSDEDIVAAINQTLDGAPPKSEDPFQKITTTRYLREEAQKRGIELDQETLEQLNVYESEFKHTVADNLQTAANDENFKKEDLNTLLFWAGQYDLPVPDKLQQTAEQSGVYNMSKAVSKALADTHGAIEQTVDNMPDTDKVQVNGQASDAETKRVYNEKFGTGVGSTGPGMGLHARMMAEAIRDGDIDKATRIHKQVMNFAQDQRGKITTLDQMIEAAERGDFDAADAIGQRRSTPIQVQYRDTPTKAINALKKLRRQAQTEQEIMLPLVAGIGEAFEAGVNGADSTSSPDTTSTETASQDETGAESPQDGAPEPTQVAGTSDTQGNPSTESVEGQELSPNDQAIINRARQVWNNREGNRVAEGIETALRQKEGDAAADLFRQEYERLVDEEIARRQAAATSTTNEAEPATDESGSENINPAEDTPISDASETPSEDDTGDNLPITDDDLPPPIEDDERPPEAFDEEIPPQYDDMPPPDSYDGQNWEPTEEDEAWAARYQEENPFHDEHTPIYDPDAPIREEWDQEVDAAVADEFVDAADKILNDEEVPSHSQAVVDNGTDISRTRQSQLRKLGKKNDDGSADNTQVYKTDDDADTRAQKIALRLLKFKLPSKLSNVLTSVGETTANLLNGVPNFHRAFLNSGVRAKLAEKLGLDPEQANAMTGMANFMGRFTTQLNNTRLQWMGTEGKKRTADNNFLWTSNGLNAVRSLRQYGLQYFYDRLGNLHPNVESAMALAGYQWLATRGVGGIENTPQRINFLLGRDENTRVTDEELAQFGRGTPKSAVAQAIGQQVLKSLGLKLKKKDDPNYDSLFIARLEASIGNMVLGTMTDMGSIESVRIDAESIKKAVNRGLTEEEAAKAENNVEGTVEYVFASSSQDRQGNYVLSEESNQVVNDYSQNALLLEKLFGFPDRARPPVFDKPGEEHVSKKYGRSETAVPQTLRERIQKMQERPVRVNRGIMNMITQYTAEEFAEQILKAPTEQQIKDAHEENKASLEAKRKQAIRSYKQAVDWDKNAGDQDFYFTYDVTSTGRINLSSNTVNPQNNTMHRWMYRMAEWTTKVSKNPTTAEERRTEENFLITIGLGMDIDFSKYTRKGVLDRVWEMYVHADQSGVLDAMNRLQEGEASVEDKALIQSWVGGIKMESKVTREGEIEYGGEGMHSFAALKALAGWHAAEGSYETSLPAETDGKTNGFSAGALQTPGFWSDEAGSKEAGQGFKLVKQMLAATGVFFPDTFLNGKQITSYPTFNESGGRDNYQQISDKTDVFAGQLEDGNSDTLAAIVPPPGDNASDAQMFEHEEGSLIRDTKDFPGSAIRAVKALGVITINRSFAKGPLTVIAYMGGMRGVKWAMVNDAIKDLYLDLDKKGTFEEVAAWHNKVADAVNAGLPEEKMTKVTGAQLEALAKKKGMTLEQYRQQHKLSYKKDMDEAHREALGRAIYHTYGYALEAALTEQVKPFGEIRKAINSVLGKANKLFAADFRERIRELEERTGQEANPAQRKALLQQMIREGAVPTVRSPLSESHLDAIQITKDGRIYSTDRNSRGRGEAHYNTAEVRNVESFDKDGNSVDPKPVASGGSRLRLFDPSEEIGVAGLVKLIHSTDGAVNSKVFADHPILNIHDAQLGGINAIDEVASDANNEFFRLHREYNIAQEVIDAYERQRVAVTDRYEAQRLQELADYLQDRADVTIGQLRQWQKEGYSHPRIFKELGLDPKKELERFGKTAAKTKDVEKLVTRSIAEESGTVRANTFTRTKLFQGVRWVNQFAKDGTQVAVNQNGSATAPTPEEADANRLVSDMQRAAANPYTDPVATFLDSVRDKSLTPAQLVAVIGRYLDGRMDADSRETMARVLQNIRDNIPGDVKVVLSTNLAPDVAAQFDADTNTVYLRPKPTATTISEFLHEMNHAALVPQLVRLVQDAETDVNKKAELQELYTNAQEFFRKAERSRDPALRAMAKSVKSESAGKVMAEYLAYATTGLRPLASGLIAPASVGSSFQTVDKDIAKLVDKDSRPGKESLGSSGRPVQRSGLQNEQKFQLNADTFRKILRNLANIEGPGALSPAAREMLDSLIEDHVIQGLRDIDEVIVRLGTNPNGTRNVGELMDDGTIYLEASGANQVVPGSMSLQETFVHEVVHAITKQVLEESPAIRNQAQKLFDRAAEMIKSGDDLLADPANATASERAEAQAMYDYLFNNEDQGSGKAPRYLHEFIALATTNHGLAEKLKTIEVPTKEENQSNDLFTFARNILSQIFGFLTNALRGPDSKTLSAGMQQLMVDISNIRREQEARSNYLLDKSREVADWSDEKLIQIANQLSSKLKAWAKKQNAPENFHRKPVQALKAMTLSGMQADVEGTRQVLEEFFADTRKDTWFFEMLSEVMPYPEKNKTWIGMLRKSQTVIDMARQNAAEHTRAGLLGAFDPKFLMKPKHREALTYAILDTDLGALMRGNTMTLGRLMEILKDPSARNSELQNLEQQLQDELANIPGGDANSNAALTEWIRSQTSGLAEFMINGVVRKPNQLLNAHNIVKQVGLDKRDQRSLPDDAETVERLISIADKMATVKAVDELSRSDGQQLSLALEVIEHEMGRGLAENGFKRLVGESIAFVDESRESLFNGERWEMIKGYTQEIYDDNIDMRIMPDSRKTRADMARKGYKFRHTLPKDPDDPSPTMAVFTSARGIAGYNKSIVSLSNPRRMGTSIYDNLTREGNPDYALAAKTASNAVQKIKRTQEAKARSRTRAANQEVGVFMLPLVGSDGQIKDYRYVMSESSKRELLKKRNFFDEVLPTQVGAIIDRTKSKDINREVVDLLKEEHDTYWVQNEDRNKSNVRFREISPTSKDKEAREMWYLLPDDMKAAAKDAFGSERLVIREEAVNLVLGFRKLSLAQGKAGDFFGPTAPFVKMAESVWQESLQFLRHKIAIATLEVVLGNIVSNGAILLTERIPPEYITRKTQEGIVNMRKYQREKRVRDMLERSIKADDALGKDTTAKRSKLARLDANLRTNPVAMLVEEGLFTSIAEDLGYDQQRTSTQLLNKALNNVSSHVPGFITTVAKEAYMVPGSKTANTALVATQLGDFTARYVQMEWNMKEKGMDKEEAINRALSTFIYYNMPQNKYLQWANDNGLFMFTKFFLRSQPVIMRLFKENPARAATVLVAQKHVLSNVSGVFDENIANYAFFSGGTNKLELLPYKHFTGENGNNVLEPALLDWLNLFGIGGD